MGDRGGVGNAEAGAASGLSSDTLIPKTWQGFPTDVKEIGEIIPHAGFQQAFPAPVPPGCCITLAKLSAEAGTLGCLVVSQAGNLCILSNDHVFGAIAGGDVGSKVVQAARLLEAVIFPMSLVPSNNS